ncbi:hypothetical protein FGO68_gene16172 [Halteria grandinella]|uniref:Uncharacterized protein n=1 Tax=Halteria grandinella TaxID=5974 RepID=A0A8J8P925_HALGN|nr:hypothetical protein FGO68_gene16172 [Halteria grandinella]
MLSSSQIVVNKQEVSQYLNSKATQNAVNLDSQISRASNFLHKTRKILAKCTEANNLVQWSAKKLTDDMTQLEVKTKAALNSFQAKLESYLKDGELQGGIALTPVEEDSYFETQEKLILSIESVVDKYRILGHSLSGQIRAINPIKEVRVVEKKKGPPQTVKIAPPTRVIKPKKVANPLKNQIVVASPEYRDASLQLQPKGELYDMSLSTTIIESFRYVKGESLISCSKTFLSLNNDQNSAIYQLKNNSYLQQMGTLSTPTHSLVQLDRFRVVLNQTIYRADAHQLVEIDRLKKGHNARPLKYMAVFFFDNKLIYSSKKYPKIKVFDLETDQEKNRIYLTRGQNQKEGITHLQAIPNHKDDYLFLLYGLIYKFTLDLTLVLYNESELVYPLKGEVASRASDFRIMPDAIHILALNKNQTMAIVDIFTSEVKQRFAFDFPAKSFYFYPENDSRSLSKVLLTNTAISRTVEFDLKSGYVCSREEPIGLEGQFNSNTFIGIDNEGRGKIVKINQNEMNLIGRVPCNRFDLIRSAIAHNDNIIFSSSRYQKIYVWDFNLANQAKGYQMRPGISMTDGIKDLQAIKGMSDTFVYIYNGILFKHALIKDDQRNYSDIIHQGNKNMATLKILPDNIHLAAISSKQEFFIIDHFTSQVVKIGIIKHSFQSTLSFYLHPRFDLYKYPIVLLSDKHTTQIFDCVESGLQITEPLYPMGIFEAFDTKHIISKRNWQFYIQQVE